MTGEKISESFINPEQTAWDDLENVKMRSPNAGEPWTDYPDEMEEIDESEEDVNGVPQTVWRGERLYLDNIDELGKRNLSTAGHEGKSNRDGMVFLSRDKYYASTYAVGKDGVKFYDEPLPVEQIPIGVIYKINNQANHLNAVPTDDEPETFGSFEGKFREFVAKEIPTEDYEVSEIYIMDDFKADDFSGRYSIPDSPYKNSGHIRSDFRQPMESYKVKDQKELPEIIAKVKKRMYELDAERKNKNPIEK